LQSAKPLKEYRIFYKHRDPSYNDFLSWAKKSFYDRYLRRRYSTSCLPIIFSVAQVVAELCGDLHIHFIAVSYPEFCDF
jgi:hypothetical protein